MAKCLLDRRTHRTRHTDSSNLRLTLIIAVIVLTIGAVALLAVTSR